MAMRYAYQYLAKPVMNLFRGQSAGDLVLRFGPDIGYSLIAGGFFAPENATLAERGAMMGEDLLYGVGSSLAGQLAGRRVGMAKAKKNLLKEKNNYRRDDRLADNPKARDQAMLQARNTVNAYTTGGDVLGQMGMVMLPRPVTQGVYEAAAERGNVEAQQVNETQRGMLEGKAAAEAQTHMPEEQMLMVALGQLAEAGLLTTQQINQPQISARALNA